MSNLALEPVLKRLAARVGIHRCPSVLVALIGFSALIGCAAPALLDIDLVSGIAAVATSITTAIFGFKFNQAHAWLSDQT